MLWNTKPGMTLGKRRRTQNDPLNQADPDRPYNQNPQPNPETHAVVKLWQAEVMIGT